MRRRRHFAGSWPLHAGSTIVGGLMLEPPDDD
jgi:hypothetical protein